jgi:hypothetical protein
MKGCGQYGFSSRAPEILSRKGGYESGKRNVES